MIVILTWPDCWENKVYNNKNVLRPDMPSSIVDSGFPGGSVVKNLPANQDTWVWSLEKETATHSTILAWEIPWTEEPGGQYSMGSQRVRHDLATQQR